MNPTLEQVRRIPAAAPRISFAAILLCAALAFLWFILCRDLSLEWSSNEQYSYGWFVPFFAAFLFWLRFEDAGHLRSGYPLSVHGYSASTDDQKHGRDSARPSNHQEIETRNRPPAAMATVLSLLAGGLLLLLLPIRLFEVANPDWRPLSWVHALTVVGLTLLVINYWGGKAAVRHFAFPVCFILFAVPWLTPIEAPLVNGLMRLVAAVATETLTLFGIPAQLEGSLIRVNNGVVGVSEACSGVRSLQTSLMIGLLFGELKRLTIGRRAALVGTALGIALLANFGRAFFLVWVAATDSLAAVERWHDIAGYAIVGAVFIGTIAIAAALGKKGRTEEPEGHASACPGRAEARPSGAAAGTAASAIIPPSSFILLACTWLLVVEAGVTAWYRWHERNFLPTTAWSVRWPEDAPGFRELTIAENIRSTLRYDSGREAAWRFDPASPDEPPGLSAQCTMFFFRWEPGSASILRARAHRPDICLPNSGWRLTSDEGVREYRTGDGDFVLPFRHFRFVRDIGGTQPIYAEAFFCQREDRVPPEKPDRTDVTAGRVGSWMRDDRVRVVLQGLRNPGQQVMEFVLLTREMLSRTEVETHFAQLVPGLVTTDQSGNHEARGE